jgi:hypothetical protein
MIDDYDFSLAFTHVITNLDEQNRVEIINIEPLEKE